MTPRQKKLKLESIIALITGSGFTIDNYGNYKQSLAGTEYRIKIKKVNIRIESKLPGSSRWYSWYKISSQPIVAIDISKLVAFMSRFLT